MKRAHLVTRPLPRRPLAASSRGAALLEFALVSLALYLVLAALISFGRWMALTQSAQDAARVAAREIALHPLPPEYGLEEALADPSFQGAVYDPAWLVIDLGQYPYGPALEQVFATMPVVNRALRPLMIRSDVEVSGQRLEVLHVPGAIAELEGVPGALTVVVPRIVGTDPNTGDQLIEVVPFLEEVTPGAFALDSPERGLAAIRLNVPFQSAMLSAYTPGVGGAVSNHPVLAVDPAGGFFQIIGPGPDGVGPYSGTFGLGEHLALGQRIRPFRRLIAAQAVFRREVFR